MHRIDVPSATPDNKFTDGSPSGGVPATTVPADWLNDLQENVCHAIEQAGITLVKDDETQLYDAIIALAAGGFLTSLGAGGNGVADYVKIPFKDKTTGVRRELVIQWANIDAAGATSGAVTFPLMFPNACRFICPSDLKTALGTSSVSFSSPTQTGCNWFGIDTSTGAAANPAVFQYIALGL
jgi:hypothetical protein